MTTLTKERSTDNLPDGVRSSLEYLRTGGLGEVIGFTSMALEMGEPKVQSDTDMAMALCLLAADALDAAEAGPVGSEPVAWEMRWIASDGRYTAWFPAPDPATWLPAPSLPSPQFRPLYAAPPAPAIPEGWKLVPVEPTEAMVGAGIEARVAELERERDEAVAQAEWWKKCDLWEGTQHDYYRSRALRLEGGLLKLRPGDGTDAERLAAIECETGLQFTPKLALPTDPHPALAGDAAAKVKLAKAVEALRPFAKALEQIEPYMGRAMDEMWTGGLTTTYCKFTMGDFRRARAAIAELEG